MTTTSTTSATSTTTPAPVDYPMPYTKGAYVARIVGPHGRFGLDREFLTGKTNKRAGRAVYELTPGWYDVRTGKGKPSTLVAVDSAGQVEEHPMPKSPEVLRQLGRAGRRGETIDTPGAWNGRACWCGADVAAYVTAGKAAGRARCDDHYDNSEQETNE